MSAAHGLALAAALGLLWFQLPCLHPPEALPAAPGGDALDSAQHLEALRQLDRATALRRALVGTTGARRGALREQAIEAYRAVRRAHPRAHAVGAEAAFRAAELLRAAGRAEEAEVELRAAVALGAGTPFRARGGIELGHLMRRAGRAADALREYERVRSDPRAELEQRHEATWWAGRVHEAEGRSVDAIRLYERVARDAEDPLDQIRGYDSWASVLVRVGDLEGAAGVLESCRIAMRDRALEETRFGLRVRAALEGMRALALLERAVAERRAARVPPRVPQRVPPRVPPRAPDAGERSPFDPGHPPRVRDARAFPPLERVSPPHGPPPSLHVSGSSAPTPFPSRGPRARILPMTSNGVGASRAGGPPGPHA